jgi:hypothetical protein
LSYVAVLLNKYIFIRCKFCLPKDNISENFQRKFKKINGNFDVLFCVYLGLRVVKKKKFQLSKTQKQRRMTNSNQNILHVNPEVHFVNRPRELCFSHYELSSHEWSWLKKADNSFFSVFFPQNNNKNNGSQKYFSKHKVLKNSLQYPSYPRKTKMTKFNFLMNFLS